MPVIKGGAVKVTLPLTVSEIETAEADESDDGGNVSEPGVGVEGDLESGEGDDEEAEVKGADEDPEVGVGRMKTADSGGDCDGLVPDVALPSSAAFAVCCEIVGPEAGLDSGELCVDVSGALVLTELGTVDVTEAGGTEEAVVPEDDPPSAGSFGVFGVGEGVGAEVVGTKLNDAVDSTAGDEDDPVDDGPAEVTSALSADAAAARDVELEEIAFAVLLGEDTGKIELLKEGTEDPTVLKGSADELPADTDVKTDVDREMSEAEADEEMESEAAL
ncbi:hypothetical protein HETIRDRAFT_424094 [Heterobasidion irregulare TC 32-1]|uniref:Uncharacterized protein n=1 Tax=Heterobasidion irregulare (strain TC 32-1) TaxID=747525 RepID=W4KMV0_HETIT|nr:uncharacterized protein HETIRDRAFT_424094 [Heterobasidion irregulare TC 32-1]ETW87173.1 hypothetical protein HETIRDRAFT_424094 [Heterobasidion irregulare TC 32-1]